MRRHEHNRKRLYKSVLTIPMILAWADEYHREHGKWPHTYAGRIKSAPDETWQGVAFALYKGNRGLPGGTTLVRLLRQRRGVRVGPSLLDENEIFRWAQLHFKQTGQWPNSNSGPILAAPGETWRRVHEALKSGWRGLPGASSLTALLVARGATNVDLNRPALTAAKILAWADAFHKAHGQWPYANSGPIDGAPRETWKRVNTALIQGGRGLPGGSSLSIFLNEHRGIFDGGNRRLYPTRDMQRLDLDKIMEWAHAFHKRTGAWPHPAAGLIPGSGGLPWRIVDNALRTGRRGLPGGSSLAKLFGQKGSRTRE